MIVRIRMLGRRHRHRRGHDHRRPRLRGGEPRGHEARDRHLFHAHPAADAIRARVGADHGRDRQGACRTTISPNAPSRRRLLDAQGKRTGLAAVRAVSAAATTIDCRSPGRWPAAIPPTDIAEAEEMLAAGAGTTSSSSRSARASPRPTSPMSQRSRRRSATRASVRVDVNQAWSEATAAAVLPLPRRTPASISSNSRSSMRTATALARLAARALSRDHGRRSAARPRDAPSTIAQQARGRRVRHSRSLQSGGLFAAGKVAAIADAAGIGLYGGTMLEGAVGDRRLRSSVLDLRQAGVGHRAVRPAAADRGNPRGAARLQRIQPRACRPARVSASPSTKSSINRFRRDRPSAACIRCHASRRGS